MLGGGGGVMVDELLQRAGLLDGAGSRYGEGSVNGALGGGDVASVWRRGGYVIKTGGAGGGAFPAEAAGLRRLGSVGWPVPSVLYADEDGLVMEYVAAGEPDWAQAGEVLARLHTAPANAPYGSTDSQSLFLGRLQLPVVVGKLNEVMSAGRLLPLADACGRTLGPLRNRLDRWLTTFEWPSEGPVWVHGDLWSGNLLHGADGVVLIDPCAQVSERAMDIAMMRLFGGFPREFWRAYEATAPLPREVEQVLPAWRLVFLLAHVAMFGRSYLGATADALTAAGG